MRGLLTGFVIALTFALVFADDGAGGTCQSQF